MGRRWNIEGPFMRRKKAPQHPVFTLQQLENLVPNSGMTIHTNRSDEDGRIAIILPESELSEAQWAQYQQWLDIAPKTNTILYTDTMKNTCDPIYPETIRVLPGMLRSACPVLVFNLYKETNSEGVHLGHIRRNQDPSFKGIGLQVYQRVRQEVRKAGHKFISVNPINERVRSYWESHGFSTPQMDQVDDLRPFQQNPNRLIDIL